MSLWHLSEPSSLTVYFPFSLNLSANSVRHNYRPVITVLKVIRVSSREGNFCGKNFEVYIAT
jgi:hypothetical protein